MKKDSTLAEVLTGIIVVGIVEQIVCLLFFDNHMYNAIGLWSGIGLVVGMAVHMQRTLEDGLDLGGEMAAKYIKKASKIRLLVACLVIGVVLYLEWGNPLTILTGVTALKIAAYMQPLTHKYFQKIQRKGG